MRWAYFCLLATLLAPDLARSAELPWGITLGQNATKTVQDFTFVGTADKARWERQETAGQTHLRFVCAAVNACFSMPARGDFVFLNDRLAEVSLSIQREQAPKGYQAASHLLSIKGKYGLTQPSAVVSAVGRRTEYHLFDEKTVVWVQDGADADVKIYLDALSPIGRAEAVAAGADAQLKHLPGALLFSHAHKAVINGKWASAEKTFETLLEAPEGASPLLLEQGRFLLAMCIAARLKTEARQGRVDRKNIPRALDRARMLAPALTPNLDALQDELLRPVRRRFD